MTMIIARRGQVEETVYERPFSLISIRDPLTRPVVVKDAGNLVNRLDLEFNDIDEPMPGLVCPSADDARRILAFIEHVRTPDLICQCEIGIGRSLAIGAFYDRSFLKRYSHNRLLYRLLHEAAGKPLPPEPLVSMAVRVKYPSNRLLGLIMAMDRQRHKNWEIVAVTDGPRPDLCSFRSPFIKVIETPEQKGRWGHPYRQLALDACRGEYIGMSNDDNYYCPGYLEQMLDALDEQKCDMVLCNHLHSYCGWGIVSVEEKPGACDLGSWIAKADLVRQVPWTGDELIADADYIAKLCELSRQTSRGVAFVRRPLFIHN